MTRRPKKRIDDLQPLFSSLISLTLIRSYHVRPRNEGTFPDNVEISHLQTMVVNVKIVEPTLIPSRGVHNVDSFPTLVYN